MIKLFKEWLNPPPPTTYYKNRRKDKAVQTSVDTDKTQSELVQLLISGKFQSVFNVLTIKFKDDAIVMEQIVLISHRYQLLSQNKNKGVLTIDEIRIETMNISAALLSIINQ